MLKTQSCLVIAKLCLAVCLLLCLLFLPALVASADDEIQARLNLLKAENFWPLKKDAGLSGNCNTWQATLWAGSETRQVSEQITTESNTALSDLKWLRVRTIAGIKKRFMDISEIDKIKLENLPTLRESYFYANYKNDILETLPKLPKLEALNLSHNKISDMQRLGTLDTPVLQYLDLRGNNITRAELSGEWPQLRELVLRGNKINEIMLSNLPKLEALDLSSNDIGSMRTVAEFNIPMTLQYLDLSYNGISRAQIPGNTPYQLRTLVLAGNEITEIELDNLPALESLDLSYNNKLKSIHGLDKLTALKKLDISYTNITSLKGLENLVNLEELKAQMYIGNDLQSLKSLENLTNLQFLHIEGVFAKHITGLDNLTNLRELYLDGKIGEMGGFDNLQNLQKLTIRSAPLPFKIEGLDNLKALRELNLMGSYTRIEGLDHLLQLEKLTISSMLLQRIEGLDKLVKLKRLKLSGCRDISKMENLNTLVNLKELALPGCGLTDITGFGGLPQPEILETLNLSGNSIKTFDNAPLMPSLQNLNLATTGLTAFSNVQPLPNVQRLNLSNNPLSNDLGSLHGCPNLETLDLSSTSISNIQNLAGLTKLKELNLSKNTLKSLDGLETLVSLQWLNLQSSRFTTIKNIPPSLRYLQMERSTITNLEFLGKAQEPLNLQILIANDSKISGTADFSHTPNLKYIDLFRCGIDGITGFEHLPFDAYLDLGENSLPLSQIYPLTRDDSYRIWKIGSQYNVFFETLELECNQPLDLSSEKEFDNIPTDYMVVRKIMGNNQPKWKRVYQDTVYTINDGIITFLEPGEYHIYMINKAVMQYPQYYNFEPYPIKVQTGIITVL